MAFSDARRRALMLVAVVLLLTFAASVLGQRANAQGPTLTHGPLVGGVTDSSAVVWMRASGTAQVQVRYSTEPDLGSYQQSLAVTVGASSDYTAKIEIAGLSSETVYHLDIVVNGVPQLTVPYPRFRTFPLEGQATPFKFVTLNDFREVQRWDGSHAETFASADAEGPDFVIIGGDFDHNYPLTLEAKRRMFQRLYSYGNDMDDFVNLILRHYPVSHVWDDHDYGVNNGDKTYSDKGLSLAVLDEYFPVYPMTQYGCWQRFSYGHADIFLLDSRSQRDPNTDPDGPDKSMLDGDNLGDAGQLHWLLQGLAESTATWKFVETPSVFNGTSGKEDSWTSFEYERQLLLDFIEANAVQGVVLLSGDFHLGAIDDGTNSGVPEMLVPPANFYRCHQANWPTGAWSEGVYAQTDDEPLCWGYGLVTVLTDPDRIVMEVKDEEGNARVRYLHLLEPSPLAIGKTAVVPHTPVYPGDPVTYTITVVNGMDVDASSVVVTDVLPAGVTGEDLDWTGIVTAGNQVEFTVPAVVTTSSAFLGNTVVNTAYFSYDALSGSDDVAFTIRSWWHIYLPMVVRNR